MASNSVILRTDDQDAREDDGCATYHLIPRASAVRIGYKRKQHAEHGIAFRFFLCDWKVQMIQKHDLDDYDFQLLIDLLAALFDTIQISRRGSDSNMS
jgi:hypothetical protein